MAADMTLVAAEGKTHPEGPLDLVAFAYEHLLGWHVGHAH